MDFGFYKRDRAIRPFFYPRKPAAQVAPAAPAQQPAGSRAKQPATTTVWSVPAQPPSTVAAMETVVGNGVAPSGGGGGASDADVDQRAALYISRVHERLRRERMTVVDWRRY